MQAKIMLRVHAARGGVLYQQLRIRPLLRHAETISRPLCFASLSPCGQLAKHHVTPLAVTPLRNSNDHVISAVHHPLVLPRAWLSSEEKKNVGGVEEGGSKWNLANVRRILREYGTVAVVFHTCSSLTFLGISYTIVNMGVDVERFLNYFHVTIPMGKAASTFAIAYLAYKLFLPVRAAITITAVPIIVRWLRAKGIMKAPVKQTLR